MGSFCCSLTDKRSIDEILAGDPVLTNAQLERHAGRLLAYRVNGDAIGAAS